MMKCTTIVLFLLRTERTSNLNVPAAALDGTYQQSDQIAGTADSKTSHQKCPPHHGIMPPSVPQWERGEQNRPLPLWEQGEQNRPFRTFRVVRRFSSKRQCLLPPRSSHNRCSDLTRCSTGQLRTDTSRVPAVPARACLIGSSSRPYGKATRPSEYSSRRSCDCTRRRIP